MVGMDARSTMDMDATAKSLSVSLSTIKQMIGEIAVISV